MTHKLRNRRASRNALAVLVTFVLGTTPSGSATYAFASDATCPLDAVAPASAPPVPVPRVPVTGSANLVVQVPAMTFIDFDARQIRTNTRSAPRPSDEFVAIQAHQARPATSAERAQALGCP